MSSCTMYAFIDGKPELAREFGNSWRGAAFIWNAVFERYLKDPNREYDNWLSRASGSDRSLWDLVKRKDLAGFIRAVHCATFDNAIIRQEHFMRFAADLREFEREFGNEHPSHLPGWAQFMEEHPDAQAVAFRHTSVSEDPWNSYDEEKDEMVPYDLSTGEKHWDIYDHLAELDAPAEANVG